MREREREREIRSRENEIGEEGIIYIRDLGDVGNLLRRLRSFKIQNFHENLRGNLFRILGDVVILIRRLRTS